MKKLFFALMALLLASVVNAEDVTLTTKTGPLHGTLELPKSAASPPVIVIISGSGPTDRDGNIQGAPGKNNGLRYLAEALSRNGVASLRFDKRGVGKSVTSWLREGDLRFETYSDDAAAWIQYLKSRGTFRKLYILGHSEGSLVGLVAAQRGNVDGFISVSGVGRSADAVILEQMRKRLPPDLMKETEGVVAALKSGRRVPSPPPALNPLFRESVQPYLISWFKYEPEKEMAKLAVPVLVAQGTTDIQVTVDDARLLHHAAGKNSTLVVIEGMNHVLKHVPSDTPKQLASYADPALPVSEELVNAILKFVRDTGQLQNTLLN